MPEKGAPPKAPKLQRRLLKAVSALSSPLLPDDYLELINPLWSTRELRGRVEAIEEETPDAATVVIRPGYDWERHVPGQYLRIGVDVGLGGVEGNFTLPKPLPEKLLFLSAGSGITPIMSMLRNLDRQDDMNDVVVLHSAPTEKECIFQDQLRELDRRYDAFRLHLQI